MGTNSEVSTAFDPVMLAENFARLDSLDLMMVCAFLAVALYCAFEGFFNDDSAYDFAETTGRVVAETSGWADDFRQYSVEFQFGSGKVQVIRKVRHPLRDLSIGEIVTVRYPLHAPEKAKVRFSPGSVLLMKTLLVGGMLTMVYTILSRA
jgi:hypothetical protein